MSKQAIVGSVLVLLVAAMLAGTLGGVLLDRAVLLALVPPSGVAPEDAANMRLIAEAWKVIRREYVDQEAVRSEVLTYGAIAGSVEALGDYGHSRFLTPQMVEMQRRFTRGQFEGIGAYVEMKGGQPVVAAPMDDSPAQRAGLKPGDVILKVNGESTAGLALDEVVARVLGPAGTTVTLTLYDPRTGLTRDVTIERAQIRLRNVTWEQVPGTQVAHVRVAAFSSGVAGDLEDALLEIQRLGLRGVVLDLRNNPGGVLDEAVGVASQFLTDGNVLLARNAQGVTQPVPVEPGGVATDVPLAVLVNGGSASGAEVVAGALQDAERAPIVGETTFGTGTVLREFPLSDGSVLLLAIQEWLTPNGRTIWHRGIEPDVEVELAPGVGPLLPLAERDMTPDALAASGDTQLLRALELLGEEVP